ncbi:hypothetical protein G3I59_01680 [Amycolatopsis rubida]|uniref:Uncharacterized protein n=1 Tax=Amycolatopsis rubida TaxID=112413 RepID=A0ABX0BI19_9PSEU|nr:MULTISPECIES: hypothetical protein [Amycolatopsis]MYW89377.1 hypothetical protein [Amycolatopsis rubida]NEC54354.1 hypothetical protein [Amycolatopsis rubida]
MYPVLAAGIRPTRVDALPPQLAALNRTYLSTAELVVRPAAARERLSRF